MNLWVVFLTGLTVGGLTCLAVQGGLLASVITAREDETHKNTKKHALYATVSFLIFKLLAYTLLGFVLGAFGGALNIGDNVQTVMQLIAGIYMLAIAGNLLNIHPIFRYAIIQPPRFLTRLVRNQSRSKDFFAPALLGLMTIFIPCGTTIAMEALAISSANALTGGLIMAVFTLGTIPLFFGIGLLTSILGDAFKKTFLKIAAIIVVYLGITAINGSLIALNFPLHSQSISEAFQAGSQPDSEQKNYSEMPTTQAPVIYVTSSGYEPNYVRVKKGEPVTLKFVGKDAYSCAAAIRIPELGVSRNLQSANDTFAVTFTSDNAKRIRFSCSMGMYTGVIDVI